MTSPVLVAYATRYGSTQEVAEAVAATLREGGLEADVRPMQEVRTLEGHRAVVLGAPLYMGHLHKDADTFLSRYREALAERPVAIFALGPLSNDREIPLAGTGPPRDAWRQVRPVEAEHPPQVADRLTGEPAAWIAGQRRAGLDGDPRLGERPGSEASA